MSHGERNMPLSILVGNILCNNLLVSQLGFSSNFYLALFIILADLKTDSRVLYDRKRRHGALL